MPILTDAFLTRRIPLAGRRLSVSAPAGDYALRHYRSGGSFRQFATLCRAVLTPDAVVLDVGANIGLTALVAAEVVAQGHVLAVEAAPRNHAALVRNLSEHAPGIAIAIHGAVGAGPGEVRFVENSTFGHILSDEAMVEVPSTQVPLTTIDALVAERRLERVDLIKLDIEGFEQDALEGAGATLARFDPVVLLEFNVWCQIALFDRNPRRFLDFLVATFPELYVWRDERLTSIHAIGPLEFLRVVMTEHRCNDDLIAVRDPARLAALRRAGRSGSRGFFRRLRGRA